MPIIYSAVFLDSAGKRELLRRHAPSLSKPVQDLHVTVKFKPKSFESSIQGLPVIVHFLGYGCDGFNEGFLVHVESHDEKLKRLLEQIPVQHMTLSVSDTGKPVDTANLHFERLKEEFSITGYYGYFDGKTVHSTLP